MVSERERERESILTIFTPHMRYHAIQMDRVYFYHHLLAFD